MKAVNRYFLLFLIISAIQVVLIGFWGSRKENLYWDEFYTLERAHYRSSSNAQEHFIDEDPDFKVGEWMPISFVKDTLIVGEEESLLKEPLWKVLIKLTRGYNYSAFLNLAESILSMGEFSLWPSIVLNILFFVLNQCVLFFMCKELTKNQTFSLSVCAMYGFSSICVSMAVFIRFYMLTTLLISLFTLFHVIYYKTNDYCLISHIKRGICLFLAFVALYLAHNNAQYAVIYGGIFVIVFAFLLMIKKGMKRLLFYMLPMFGGGFAYLYTQTEYLRIFSDFQNVYSEANTALASTLDGIVDFKFEYLPNRLLDMTHIWGRYLFGSFIGMLLFAIVLLFMFVISKTKRIRNVQKEMFSPVIIVPSISAIVYILIFTVFGLYAQVRYVSFVFPELTILVMYLVYKALWIDKHRIAFAVALILMVVLSVNTKAKVDMLYTGDRASIDRIRETGINAYLLNAGNHITFMTYETAFVARNEDYYFVYNCLEKDALNNLVNNLRDKMILVGYYGVSTQDLQDVLIENGYQVEWIADTYNYVFYTAVKN